MAETKKFNVLQQELITRLDKFADEAVLLSDAISAANAEELVCDGYPFDKSFDEITLGIIEWKNAVEETILHGWKLA